MDRSHHAEHIKPVRIWLNLTVLEIYAKSYCLTPMFPTSFLCKIPQETFIPCLVAIGQVVSEEKSFEKKVNDNDGPQVMAIAHMAIGQVS